MVVMLRAAGAAGLRQARKYLRKSHAPVRSLRPQRGREGGSGLAGNGTEASAEDWPDKLCL